MRAATAQRSCALSGSRGKLGLMEVGVLSAAKRYCATLNQPHQAVSCGSGRTLMVATVRMETGLGIRFTTMWLGYQSPEHM